MSSIMIRIINALDCLRYHEASLCRVVWIPFICLAYDKNLVEGALSQEKDFRCWCRNQCCGEFII